MAWTCPDCNRSFGAKGRNHMCKPGLTIEEFLSTARPETGAIPDDIDDDFFGTLD